MSDMSGLVRRTMASVLWSLILIAAWAGRAAAQDDGWFYDLPFRAQVLLKVAVLVVGVAALWAIWYYLFYFWLLRRWGMSPDTSFHAAWVLWGIMSILTTRLVFWDFLSTFFWIFWITNAVCAVVWIFTAPRAVDA